MRTALLPSLPLRPSEPRTEGARSTAASSRCAVLPRELCTEAQAEPVPSPLLELSASPLEFSASPCDGEGASHTHGLQAGFAGASGAAATGG